MSLLRTYANCCLNTIRSSRVGTATLQVEVLRKSCPDESESLGHHVHIQLLKES